VLPRRLVPGLACTAISPLTNRRARTVICVGQMVGRSGVGLGAIRGWTRGHRDAAIGLLVGGSLAVLRITVEAVPAAYTVSAVLAILAIAGGLTLRRRAPLTGYLVGCTGLMIDATTPDPLSLAPYANLFGFYSLALYTTRRRAWVGMVFMLLFVGGYVTVAGGKAGLEADATTGATIVVSWLALWTIGYTTARRREEQLVARHLLRRQAVADERTRIARELHDLIGHTVNVMLLQAGASRRVLDGDPARARELLIELERVGRDALTELDRVLGVLRAADDIADAAVDDDAADDAGVAEAPGVAVLPDLARRMTHAGLRVTLEVAPGVAPLPKSLDLTVHRIVQEALTNALKHGKARAACVVVRRADAALDVEVSDDGLGVAAGYAPGRGLLGMRERAALFGGSVEHGPSERGGFRVQVRLPMTAPGDGRTS
jgi:signal transduction histidine kinase